MAYLYTNPDRFSLSAILQENHYDTDSVLVSDKFLNMLTETEKMSLADMMSGSASKNSGKKLEVLNRKGTFLDLKQTEGNFSKSKAYPTTKQCLSLLKPIIERSKGKNTVEATKAYQCCETAMANLEKHRDYFEKAYKDNDAANILAYQTIAVATIEFASIILINCTVFDENGILKYQDPPNKSLAKNILFKNLEKFNDICRNNKLKLNEDFERKLEEFNMVHHESIGAGLTAVGIKLASMGSVATGGLAAVSTPLAVGIGLGVVASSILALVYLSRTLICYYYFKKIQIAENLKYISGMIEANSASLNTKDPKASKRISSKQMSMASKLKKLGEVLDNDSKQAQHNGINQLKKEDTISSRDIENRLNPDSRDDVTAKNPINDPNDNLFI